MLLNVNFFNVKDLILIFIILIFICLLFIWQIVLFIKMIKQRRKDYKALDKPFKPVDVEVYNVTVEDKYYSIIRGSSRLIKSRPGFFVEFKLENGKVRTYEVDEKNFRRIKKGAKVQLAVADGKFVGFSKSKYI